MAVLAVLAVENEDFPADRDAGGFVSASAANPEQGCGGHRW